MTFWKSNRSNELQEFIAKLLIALYLSPKFSKQNKNVRAKKKKKERKLGMETSLEPGFLDG